MYVNGQPITLFLAKYTECRVSKYTLPGLIGHSASGYNVAVMKQSTCASTNSPFHSNGMPAVLDEGDDEVLSMGSRLTFQQYFTARQFRVKFKAFTYFGALNPSVLADNRTLIH